MNRQGVANHHAQPSKTIKLRQLTMTTSLESCRGSVATLAWITILTEHRDQLESVAQELLIKETLDASAFNALLGQREMPESTTTSVT